jgi:hypothetical protein
MVRCCGGTMRHGLFALMRETLAISDPAKRQEAINKLHLWLRKESSWIQIGYINIS